VIIPLMRDRAGAADRAAIDRPEPADIVVGF
jgi:hypothetical protein